MVIHLKNKNRQCFCGSSGVAVPATANTLAVPPKGVCKECLRLAKEVRK